MTAISCLDRFPRRPLAHLPTPLEPLDRLSRHLGGPAILVKRDDCTGLAFGGNKTRKLEFLIGDALAQGADTLITAGGVQSNHVRQTAAAAARLGLHAQLVLTRIVPWDEADYEKTGNILLDRMLGARVRLYPGTADRAAAMAEVAGEARARGRKPYVIPTGGSNPVGALGYVACARELVTQARDMGLDFEYVVHASSSGGTQAGLVLGLAGMGYPAAVLGIDVDADPTGLAATVRGLAAETAQYLGLGNGPGDDATILESGYAGRAYGLPTREMSEAVALVARLEGLLLDPVYTGKAMAGLIGLVRQGRFRSGDRVVFLHSGGTPALFAYPSAFPPATGAG